MKRGRLPARDSSRVRLRPEKRPTSLMALSPGAASVPTRSFMRCAGGMAEVYRASDLRLGHSVAIKVLLQAVTSDPDRLARFERDGRAVASLNHPNFAAVRSGRARRRRLSRRSPHRGGSSSTPPHASDFREVLKQAGVGCAAIVLRQPHGRTVGAAESTGQADRCDSHYVRPHRRHPQRAPLRANRRRRPESLHVNEDETRTHWDAA